MTRREQTRLLGLVSKPPRGSKIEAAKRYGVDLTLTIRRLGLTPTQRAREMEGALRLVEELQRSTCSTKDVQRKTKPTHIDRQTLN